MADSVALLSEALRTGLTTVVVDVRDDGTWADGDGISGKWRATDSTLTLTFSGGSEMQAAYRIYGNDAVLTITIRKNDLLAWLEARD